MIQQLVLVRHGESAANVAASDAERSGAETIDVPWRDADVPLTGRGEEQARSLAAWWRGAGPTDGTVAWSSPYLRARETLALGLEASGTALPVRVDERLRDRELGVLDLLTRRGVAARHPEEEARRHRLGKWYHRPPGGESWVDVALRLRHVLGDLLADDDATRAVVATHDVVVTLVTAVLTGMDEHEVLDFTLEHPVANASVTTLERTADGWRLVAFADVAHLDHGDAPVTEHEGDPDVRPR